MFLSCSVGEAPHHAREVLSRKAKPSVKKKIFLAVVSIAYLAHIPRPLCVPITERTNKHRSRISEARERCGAVLNVSFLGQFLMDKIGGDSAPLVACCPRLSPFMCQNRIFFLYFRGVLPTITKNALTIICVLVYNSF